MCWNLSPNVSEKRLNILTFRDLMQKEYLTERLKYLTEIFRLGWVSILAVGSGTVGLWLGPHDFWRSIFTAAGVVALVVLVGMGIRLDSAIKQVLTQLREL